MKPQYSCTYIHWSSCGDQLLCTTLSHDDQAAIAGSLRRFAEEGNMFGEIFQLNAILDN